MADQISKLAIIIDASIGGAMKGMKELTNAAEKFGTTVEGSLEDSSKAAQAFDKDLTKLVKKIASGTGTKNTVEQLTNLSRYFSSLPSSNLTQDRINLINKTIEAQNFRSSIFTPEKEDKKFNFRVFKGTGIDPLFIERKKALRDAAAKHKQELQNEYSSNAVQLNIDNAKRLAVEEENKKIIATKNAYDKALLLELNLIAEQDKLRAVADKKNADALYKTYVEEVAHVAKLKNIDKARWDERRLQRQKDLADATTAINKEAEQADKLKNIDKANWAKRRAERYATDDPREKILNSALSGEERQKALNDLDRKINNESIDRKNKQHLERLYEDRRFRENRTGANSFSRRFSYGASNLAYGIEDALTGYTVNGLKGAVLGASNNLTAVMSTMISNPLTAGLAVVGTAITAFFLPKLYEMSTGIEEAAKNAELYGKKLTEESNTKLAMLSSVRSIEKSGNLGSLASEVINLQDKNEDLDTILAPLLKERERITRTKTALDSRLNTKPGFLPNSITGMYDKQTARELRALNSTEANLSALNEIITKYESEKLINTTHIDKLNEARTSDRFTTSARFNKLEAKFAERVRNTDETTSLGAFDRILQDRVIALTNALPDRRELEILSSKLMEENRVLFATHKERRDRFLQSEQDKLATEQANQERLKVESSDLYNKIMNNNDRRRQLESELYNNLRKVEDDTVLSDVNKDKLRAKLKKDFNTSIKELTGKQQEIPIGQSIDIGSRQDAELFFRSLNSSFNSKDIITEIKNLLKEMQSMNSKLNKLPKPIKT